jgi:peptide/nickel transport system permease protein
VSRPAAGQAPGLVRRLCSRRAGQVGLALAAAIAAVAAVGPLVASNPNLTDYAHQLVGPSHLHWLGTDSAGRDELARSVAGLRTSVEAALIVFGLTSAAGVILGGLAGYCGGVVDAVISRAIDVLLGLPSLIVALAIVGALGVGYWNLVAAISFSGWAYLARITRSHVRGSRDRLDVIAARMAGVGEVRNLATHVLPGALANVLVAATSTFAEVILALAGLSFLGLGAQPPTAELGQMLSDSRGDLANAPWLIVGPTLGIVLSVAAATLLSDALRDAVDVRFSPTRARRRPRSPLRPAATPAPRDGSALAIAGLHVVYPDGSHALRGVDLAVAGGDCVALVGESGCGKTTLARAVLGLLPSGSTVWGSLLVGDTDILSLSESGLRRVRGLMVGYVAQDPFVAYDPLQSVQRHVAEAWRARGLKASPSEIAGLVGRLGVDEAAPRLRQRPYQWSGGMLQRAAMVAANAHQPAITIADEPTSALDAELADDVLGALRTASRSVVLITHDLRLVAGHAPRVAVMYAGRIVEQGPTHEVVNRPRHPYTQALLAASPPRPGGSDQGRRGPLPEALAGAPPSPSGCLPSGCAFAPRCTRRQPICTEQEPPSVEGVACWVHAGT